MLATYYEAGLSSTDFLSSSKQKKLITQLLTYVHWKKNNVKSNLFCSWLSRQAARVAGENFNLECTLVVLSSCLRADSISTHTEQCTEREREIRVRLFFPLGNALELQ